MSQLPRPLRQPPASAELAAALGACRRAFLAIALFSGMSNILMLTGSLFMLEVYDRVIPSRSVPTLVALLILAAGLYAAQGIIDAIRSRILVRVGNSLDETLSLRVYDAIVRLPLKLGVRSEGAQPIRDLDTVRGFLSGTGPIASVRPALAAGLPRHLLFVPHLYRAYRARRRDHPRHADLGDRNADAATDAQRHAVRCGAQHVDGGEPAQRRGDHGHGHGRPHRRSTGATSTATTSRARRARATSPAALARCRRSCA